jgi:hypothetical protein
MIGAKLKGEGIDASLAKRKTASKWPASLME